MSANLKYKKNSSSILLFFYDFCVHEAIGTRFYSKDKVKAIREWNKLKADRKLMKKMSAALKTQIASEEWQRDNGRAIPYPCRWLSHRRWEDQIDAAADVRTREEALPEWI